MKIILTIILSAYCLLLTVNISSASTAGDIREGNKLYKQEKYNEAADRYNQALKEAPDSDVANYNLGAALYKKGQYREAIDALTKALNTDDKGLEEKAIYNLANSKYKLGSQAATTDLNSAISMYREALNYYKRAMELDNKDKDAKYNHELVEKKLKALLDQLKNQRQNQDKNGDQDQANNGKQDSSQSQGKSGQQKEDKKQQAHQQKEQGPERDSVAREDKGKPGSKEDGKEERPSGAGKDASKGMTPEEARMLLEAYGREGALEDKRQNKRHAGEVLKDW